jgi:glutamyl-tRNA synthetase
MYRSRTPDQLIEKYQAEGNHFAVIRFRSPGDMTKRIVFVDEIRGTVSMQDNYNDIVILKGDGLPTYHLAHIVDDSLMRISLVTRGDEWLMSAPLHVQLFESFGLKAPKYAHLSPICKLDNGKKRKLSKRHDPEANVRFLLEQGYAVQGILDYVLNVTNSNFEDWRREHPDASLLEFDLKMDKMSSAGPLFDEVKLNWVNNNYLSHISTEQLFKETLHWAKSFQPAFASLLASNVDYAKAAMNIERHTEKDPKRFTLYGDVQQQLLFFFDSEWEK